MGYGLWVMGFELQTTNVWIFGCLDVWNINVLITRFERRATRGWAL